MRLLHSAIADTPSPAPAVPLLLPALAHAHAAAAEAEEAISVDSDTVVILASLLCALVCVAGLALVARCACRRGGGSVAATRGGYSSGVRLPQPQPPRGLEKAAIEALPTVVSSSSLKLKARRRGRDGDDKDNEENEECAICLAAFAEGDQLRVLPRCAHGFHAACVDTWLTSHASCPSCRATVVVSPLCRRCGAACCDDPQVMAAAEPPPAAAPWPIDHGITTLSSSTSTH